MAGRLDRRGLAGAEVMIGRQFEGRAAWVPAFRRGTHSGGIGRRPALAMLGQRACGMHVTKWIGNVAVFASDIVQGDARHHSSVRRYDAFLFYPALDGSSIM
jgi:hypothetical protein